MSTYEDLLRELKESRERAEQAEARAEQAEVRVEQERREKEQERREKGQERQRREEAEKLTRNTTLEEYLQACHEDVLFKVVLVTDGYLTSRVPTTNPTGKHCPSLLTPWNNFLATQVDIIQKIARILPNDERLFENITSLKTLGDRVHERRVTSESSLVFVENNCIEDPVRIILSKLKNYQPSLHGLFICDGAYFETNASNLRDETDGRDTTKRDEKLRTDQICVFRNADNRREIAYVIEYKAPHKLHTAHFEEGLRRMSIVDEVVNKPVIPTGEPEKFQHYAELLSAAAITQTYHYMLEAGLEYGYVTNGDAIVFLKIDWTDPTVLFYHLAQPSREVTVNEDPIYSNAVCQVLAFTLLAFQASPRGNDERMAATESCKEWAVDFNDLLYHVSLLGEKEAQDAGLTTPKGKKHRRVPSSPGWQPRPIKKIKRNPQQRLGSGQDRVLRSHDKPGGGGGPSAGGPSQGGGSTSAAPALPGRSSQALREGSSSTPSTQGSNCGSGGKDGRSRHCRPYCTPSCLLSLVNGLPLDSKCPNVPLHVAAVARRLGSKTKHPVLYARWIELLQQQLSKSLEEGVVILGLEGACGAMFQITLLQYGYTFVAKGVTGRSVSKLHNEQAVYQRLQSLQGHDIPVCLGSIDLRQLHQILFYDIDVRIIYFLLLSYGGTKLVVPTDSGAQARIIDDVTAVLDRMHCLGVAHADIRLPNVLQGPSGQVTIIDFDQATMTARSALSTFSPNKRRRLIEDESLQTTPDKSTNARPYLAKMREDRSNAQSLFTLDAGRILWHKEKKEER